MSAFAAQWLDLREPADRRARNADLLATVARHFSDHAQIAVTDLGCGTGAMMRTLAPRLPARQSWRLVDQDTGLLDAVEQRCREMPPAMAWQPHQADLQEDLEAVMALPADLVTISALLDLTSIAWLERLAEAAATHQRPVYATLTYNGRIACEPADPFDAQVACAFDAHQRRDKGFGHASGPLASTQAIEQLAARRFIVRQADADWVLDDSERALQAELVQGWYQAACEEDVLDRQKLDGWLARRLAAVRAGRTRLTVGHCDIWAYPPAPRSRSSSRS
ncbi:class I SAM-dependent methyltransferase [Vineibacter terrae]|nr:class I SAM-dependent methyltransferase [Vineibacter terrae]